MSGACWRLVEAQHHVPTMKLVGTLAEQSALESIIEETKPPVPPDCSDLHYLLATPFRYGAPYPIGSRFRRAGMTAGVFYASREAETAVAEMAFHRLLFFADSPATPWPARAGDYTAFAARYATTAGLDLAAPPLDTDRSKWTHPTAYEPCQALADVAREAGADVLRYPSARAAGGTNLALLTCRAFSSPAPIERHTWRILLTALGARAVCDFPESRLEFSRDAFSADPRIASLRWDR